MSEFADVKAQYIKALVETNALQVRSLYDNPLTLRSGAPSRIFVNHAKLTANRHAFSTYIDVKAAKLHQVLGDTEPLLCNVDSKVSAQETGALAYKLKTDQIIYRSSELIKREKGVDDQLIGSVPMEPIVVILDDVMTANDTTASSVADLIHQREMTVSEVNIFVGVNRDNTLTAPSSDTMREYPVFSVATLDEVLQAAWPVLNINEQKTIESERAHLL